MQIMLPYQTILARNHACLLKSRVCLIRTHFVELFPKLTVPLIGCVEQTMMFRKMKIILAQRDELCV